MRETWLKRLSWVTPLLVGAWVRLAVFPKVWLGGLAPSDADCEYHLRRMRLAWASFPRLSVFDPLLGWPSGHPHQWAPGFDWFGAALMRLTFSNEPSTLELAAGLYPVLLGLITIVLAMRLSWRLASGSRLAVLSAGLLVALAPQFVGASRLGRTDHHVWEAMSMLLLLGFALGERSPPWRFELRGALAVALTLLGFCGGTLYVALIVPLLLLRVLQERRPFIGTGAVALMLGALVALVVNLGPISEHGKRWAYDYPSFLQPSLVLLAALTLWVTWLVSRRSPRAVLISGAVMVMLALVTPGVGSQLRAGFGQWLFKGDPWLASIAEFQPLGAMAHPPWWFLGVAGVVSVPAFLFSLRRSRTVPRLELAFVMLALVALTALQMRFGRVLIPVLGVAFGVAVQSLPLARVMPGVVLFLFGLDPEVRRSLIIADPREPSPIEEVADGLRLERAAAGDDGVLAPWNWGSTLVARAQRPVIASAFGRYVDPQGFELTLKAFSSTEAEMVSVMQARQLSLVVAGAELFSLQPEQLRLRPIGVLGVGGSGVVGVAPHLEHLLPLRVSTAQTAPGVPVLWVYQRVPGASLELSCQPGSLITASLPALVRGVEVHFTAWTRCEPSGRATLRVALPSRYRGEGLQTGEAWSVDSHSLDVPEEAVREGRSFQLEE